MLILLFSLFFTLVWQQLGFQDQVLPFSLMLFLTGSMSHADSATVQVGGGRERGREEGMKGGKDEGREGEVEGWRERGMEGGRSGGMEGGREGGRNGVREERSEGKREEKMDTRRANKSVTEDFTNNNRWASRMAFTTGRPSRVRSVLPSSLPPSLSSSFARFVPFYPFHPLSRVGDTITKRFIIRSVRTVSSNKYRWGVGKDGRRQSISAAPPSLPHLLLSSLLFVPSPAQTSVFSFSCELKNQRDQVIFTAEKSMIFPVVLPPSDVAFPVPIPPRHLEEHLVSRADR